MRINRWLDDLRQDVRFSLRQVGRAPAFATIVVTTLALGVGVNSAIFALVDAALLRPLPYPESSRLVMLSERTATVPHGRVSPLNLLDWQARSRSFEAMAGFVPDVGGMVMEGRDGTSETVPRQWVTSGFFEVLGTRVIAGRTFTTDDDARRSNVVVLGEAFWRSRFAGDPAVVGRDIRFDGTPYTVIGVVPRDFQLVGRASMWALSPITGAPPRARGAYMFQGIGRLAPGATLDAAAGELAAVAEGLAREFPDTNRGRSVALESLHTALIGGELRLTAGLFLGVVGIVFLLCCTNVAGLLTARTAVRSGELALRSALGASRRRLIRQLMTECVVLSVVGGALGAAAGLALLRAAPVLLPPGLLPEAIVLAFDARVVAFIAATTLLVGGFCGAAPAWQASAYTAARAMGMKGRGTTARAGRMRDVLVSIEIAGAVLLMVGAGLLLRSLLAVGDTDRGYRRDNVLSLMVDPLGARYPTDDSLLQFFDAIDHEVLTLPGVNGVAWTSAVPFGESGSDQVTFDVAGDPLEDGNRRPTASYQVVSPSYFETVDLALVSGRGFDRRDTSGGTPVCLVNEAFVRRHAQGRTPLGVRLGLRPADAPQLAPRVLEIVGVARHVPDRPDETNAGVQIYVPLAQQPLDDLYLLVRPASGPAGTLASPVRAAIGRLDKEQLVSVRDVRTLESIARDATARHRFRAILIGGFAAVALVIAMAGIFGLLASSVEARVGELAVRRAVGAETRNIVALVVSRAIVVTAIGVGIGLATSTALGQSLAGVLFGVRPRDPVTFMVVVAALTMAAAASMVNPVRRAVRVDPAVELRNL